MPQQKHRPHRLHSPGAGFIITGFAAVLLLGFFGCGLEREFHYPAYIERLRGPLPTEQSVFRVPGLPLPLAEVANIEPETHRLQDSLGRVYRYVVDSGFRYTVEYWHAPQDSNQVIALNTNIFLASELQAQRLLNDLSTFLSKKTQRAPEGSYGDYHWPVDTARQVLRLRLNPDKTSLTVSYFIASNYENLYP